MSWKYVCKLSDLESGEMREFNVDGTDILILRSDEDIYAIPPLCPHQQEKLVSGVYDGCVLTCTKHLWQWNISPWTGGIGDAEVPLKRYDCKIEDGKVFAFVLAEMTYNYDGGDAPC